MLYTGHWQSTILQGQLVILNRTMSTKPSLHSYKYGSVSRGKTALKPRVYRKQFGAVRNNLRRGIDVISTLY